MLILLDLEDSVRILSLSVEFQAIMVCIYPNLPVKINTHLRPPKNHQNQNFLNKSHYITLKLEKSRPKNILLDLSFHV